MLSTVTEAIKKIRGSVSNQFVVRVAGGQFRAFVEVTEDPYLFSGQPASTRDQGWCIGQVFLCSDLICQCSAWLFYP